MVTRIIIYRKEKSDDPLHLPHIQKSHRVKMLSEEYCIISHDTLEIESG